MQPVFLGQCATDFCIADFNVSVRYGLSVVSYPIIDKMAVWMRLVEMPSQQVLGIGTSNALHIFLGNIQNQRICDALRIFRLKRKGDMSDGILDTWVQ